MEIQQNMLFYKNNILNIIKQILIIKLYKIKPIK